MPSYVMSISEAHLSVTLDHLGIFNGPPLSGRWPHHSRITPLRVPGGMDAESSTATRSTQNLSNSTRLFILFNMSSNINRRNMHVFIVLDRVEQIPKPESKPNPTQNFCIITYLEADLRDD